MKFQPLPLGARFEYEGKVYVKTGPLTATTKEGSQRMIPRFAVLKPLDEATPAMAPRPVRQLDESAVMAALEVFHGDCLRLLEDAGVGEEKGQTLRARLEEGRQRFIAALR